MRYVHDWKRVGLRFMGSRFFKFRVTREIMTRAKGGIMFSRVPLDPGVIPDEALSVMAARLRDEIDAGIQMEYRRRIEPR